MNLTLHHINLCTDNVEEMDAFFKRATANIPDLCIGTDLMVGFPGETEEDFANTIFPHPTLSEAIHESALSALERTIHY